MSTFAPEEAADIACLHQRIFERPWSEAEFRRFAADGAHLALAARLDGALRGFIIASIAAGEGEILTVAVAPEWQGHGIGSALLAGICRQAQALDAQALFLEVREDNAAARRLYASYGAAIVGYRVGYYTTRDGSHDALLMRLALGDGAV